MDKERVVCFIKAVLEILVLSLVKDHQQLWILMIVVILGQDMIKFFMSEDGHLLKGENVAETADDDPSINWVNDIISTMWTACLSEFLTVEGVTKLLEEGAKVCDEKEHHSFADLLKKIALSTLK